MNRVEGFLYSYPGFPSITVPYHDTNDFFYSGHIGQCAMVFYEYKAAKWNKWAGFAMFVLVN